MDQSQQRGYDFLYPEQEALLSRTCGPYQLARIIAARARQITDWRTAINKGDQPVFFGPMLPTLDTDPAASIARRELEAGLLSFEFSDNNQGDQANSPDPNDTEPVV